MPWNRIEGAFLRCSQKLYVVAVSVTGNRALAEDAVHEALVSVVASGAQPADIEAYLCRSVRNQALRYRKDQQRWVGDPAEFLAVRDDASADPEQGVVLQELVGALERLSKDHSETVVMHVFGGMTFREIAELRELPLNTVTSWYRRAIAKLREEVTQ